MPLKYSLAQYTVFRREKIRKRDLFFQCIRVWISSLQFAIWKPKHSFVSKIINNKGIMAQLQGDFLSHSQQAFMSWLYITNLNPAYENPCWKMLGKYLTRSQKGKNINSIQIHVNLAQICSAQQNTFKTFNSISML